MIASRGPCKKEEILLLSVGREVVKRSTDNYKREGIDQPNEPPVLRGCHTECAKADIKEDDFPVTTTLDVECAVTSCELLPWIASSLDRMVCGL